MFLNLSNFLNEFVLSVRSSGCCLLLVALSRAEWRFSAIFFEDRKMWGEVPLSGLYACILDDNLLTDGYCLAVYRCYWG